MFAVVARGREAFRNMSATYCRAERGSAPARRQALGPSAVHLYDDQFFDWVDSGALRSARGLLPIAMSSVRLSSVLDVGCGRGTWLAAWREMGVLDVVGIDGDYVDRSRLAIPADKFVPVDLTTAWSLERRFDLVQSLEVAEHIAPIHSETFVSRLCAAGDVVLFSAAQPGQGGEMHVNEQTPEYWAAIFARNGFERFDALRSHVAADQTIEPWYRYNAFLFANARGQERLSEEARATRLPASVKAPEFGGVAWKIRKGVLRHLPVATVTSLSRLNYRVRTRLRAIQHAG